MDAETKRKPDIIGDILLKCKANRVPNDGDIFLALAFKSETELKRIASELYIKT